MSDRLRKLLERICPGDETEIKSSLGTVSIRRIKPAPVADDEQWKQSTRDEFFVIGRLNIPFGCQTGEDRTTGDPELVLGALKRLERWQRKGNATAVVDGVDLSDLLES